MRQYFTLINSTLLGVLMLTILVLNMLDYRVSRYQVKLQAAPEVIDFVGRATEIPFSQVYGHRNVFASDQSRGGVDAGEATSMLDIPALVLPEVAPLPEKKPVEIVEPLPIVLSGVILSSQEDESICIVADETDKEEVFSVGDKIKDGTLLRILRDKIVVLRDNGQQETFFINETDAHFYDSSYFTSFITKDEDGAIQVHQDKFVQRFPSLGDLLSELHLLPVLDENNKVAEFQLLDTSDETLMQLLGLQPGDLFLSIEGFDLRDYRERVKAYDKVTSLKAGDLFKLEIRRLGEILNLQYNLIVAGSGRSMNAGRIVFRGDVNATNEPESAEEEKKRCNACVRIFVSRRRASEL